MVLIAFRFMSCVLLDNDPSSATRPAGRMDYNQSAMAGFAAAHGSLGCNVLLFIAIMWHIILCQWASERHVLANPASSNSSFSICSN